MSLLTDPGAWDTYHLFYPLSVGDGTLYHLHQRG